MIPSRNAIGITHDKTKERSCFRDLRLCTAQVLALWNKARTSVGNIHAIVLIAGMATRPMEHQTV